MLEEIFNDNNNTSFDENFKKKIEKENSNFNYSNKNQQYDQILPVDVVLAIKELPLGSSPGPMTLQTKCSNTYQQTSLIR